MNKATSCKNSTGRRQHCNYAFRFLSWYLSRNLPHHIIIQ